MRRTLLAVFALVALAVWLPREGSAANPVNAAYRLLAKLRLVDGVGSGLDADRLQGLTPAEVVAQNMPASLNYVAKAGDADRLQGLTPSDIVAQSIATSAAAVSLAAYRRDLSKQLGASVCDCVTLSCADTNDLRVNCGGGFMPFPSTTGVLTAMGAVPGQPTTCGVCGCNLGTASATLAGEVVCLTVP